MKNKIKSILKWVATFVLCFIIIELTLYLIVFFGGYKLFVNGDPILIELGVALILSIFVFAFNEVVTNLEKRVKSLEERLNEPKNKQ